MAKLTKKQIQDLASKGRGGDTMLAHINPEEARLLKEHGGSGTINPNTGLPEYKKFWKQASVSNIVNAVTNPVETVSNLLSQVDDAVIRPTTNVFDFETYWQEMQDLIAKNAAKVDDAVLQPITKPISDVLAKVDDSIIQPVTQPVSNVLAKVDDTVLQPVVKAAAKVEDVVKEEILAQPAGQILIAVAMPYVASYLAPYMVAAGVPAAYATAAATAVAQTTVAVASGVPFESALQAAIINSAVNIGAAELTPYVSDLVQNPQITSAVVNATATVAQGVATGQSSDQIIAGLTNSLAGSAAGLVNLVPGFSELPVAAKNTITASIKATLLDRPIEDAATQALITSGLQSAANGVIANNRIKEKYGRAATAEEIEKFSVYTSPSRLDKEITKYFVSGKGAEIQLGDYFAADGVTKLTPQQIESYVNKDVAKPEEDQSYSDFMDDFYKSIGLNPESIPKAAPTTFDPLEIYNEQFLNDPSLDLVNVVAQQEEDPSLDLVNVFGSREEEDYPSLDLVNVFGSREEDPSLDVVNVFGSPEEDPFLDLLDASPEDNFLADLTPDPTKYAKSISQVFNSSIPNFNTIAAPAFAISTLLDENENPITQSDLANLTFNWNPSQVEAPEDAAAYGQPQLDPRYTYAAHGGLMSLARGGIATLGGYSDGGRLLKGPGDGMSDNIPAMIGAKQPARLADGEFVIPADVVSHLGNGSTEAGANVLYKMMNKVRRARTGNPKQGKQINPKKFIPS